MENTALANLRKAKLIIEAEIERLEIKSLNETDLAEQSMQLLQNGLNSQDYDTMEVLQSQGLLDFNNFEIEDVFREVDGHSERAKAVLNYLISRLHFFLETYLSNDQYDAIARASETMLTLARIAKTVE